MLCLKYSILLLKEHHRGWFLFVCLFACLFVCLFNFPFLYLVFYNCEEKVKLEFFSSLSSLLLSLDSLKIQRRPVQVHPQKSSSCSVPGKGCLMNVHFRKRSHHSAWT